VRGVPRTDENGRSLESVLTYMLDGVNAQDIAAALGVSHATYYRRKREDSYPDAEELRVIARHFDLNPVDLMVRFALVTADEAGSGGGSPLATATKTKRQAKRRNVVPRVDLSGPSL
jgi:transcriptional regulator with XRE-family HTH domain